MKQKTLIIAGIVIVFILLFVWVYLLFFAKPPAPNPVFTDLGLGGVDDTGIVIAPTDPIEEPIVTAEAKLRQLTTKPVIGFVEIPAATTSPLTVYYAEAGTGHIYQIDPLSGDEKRLSNTTIAEASEATFSPSGQYVAIRSGDERTPDSINLGKLNLEMSGLETSVIQGQVADFKIVNEKELLYSAKETSGLVGHSYNLETKAVGNLFTLPFYEAAIEWGNTATGPHYVYPKSTYALEGFLYEITNSKLKRLPLEGFGFAASANSDMVLYNKINGDRTKSYVYDRKTDESRALDAVVVPEKCYLAESGLKFACGFEDISIPYEFPDTWYRGEMSFKDTIWSLDADSMTGKELINTFTVSGREIDITDLSFNPGSSMLYFINKNDNTLWLYEI